MLCTEQAVFKRTGKAFLSFSIVLIVSLGLLQFVYKLKPLTDFDQRILDLKQNQKQIEVLILGSSQMRRAVNPKYISYRAFNLSSMSQDLYYDYQLIRHFLPKMDKLRVIVWGLEYFRVAYDLSLTPNEKRLAKLYDGFIPRRFYPPTLKQWLWANLEFLRIRGNDPFVTFNTVVSALMTDEIRRGQPLRNGYSPRKSKEDVLGGMWRARVHEKRLVQMNFVRPNLNMIIKAVNELQEIGIKIIFVAPPVAPLYFNAIAPDLREQYHSFCKELTDETGVRIIDFSESLPIDQGLFHNSDHLQDDGAKRFTELLNQSLKELDAKQ